MSGTDFTSLPATILSETVSKTAADMEELEEREWQRQAAIFVVFILFFIISIIVMVIIHGGIQEHGLVLSIHKVTVNTSSVEGNCLDLEYNR